VVHSPSSVSVELKEASRLLAKEKDKQRSGLPGIECTVCLNRPVQVDFTLVKQELWKPSHPGGGQGLGNLGCLLNFGTSK